MHTILFYFGNQDLYTWLDKNRLFHLGLTSWVDLQENKTLVVDSIQTQSL
jgi:hypothetical protein